MATQRTAAPSGSRPPPLSPHRKFLPTADIYTDLGDFDQAAKYYDLYISHMDDSVV